jgi:hypothetical protein
MTRGNVEEVEMGRFWFGTVFSVALVLSGSPVAAQDAKSASIGDAGLVAPPPAAVEPWMLERPAPKSLKVLYGSYAALQGLDVYSTAVALKAGAREANPLMDTNTGSAIGLKAAMSLTTYYAVNKLGKKNRKGAVVVMAILNGVTAAVVANNLKNSRR